jgi:hypothetical protein
MAQPERTTATQVPSSPGAAPGSVSLEPAFDQDSDDEAVSEAFSVRVTEIAAKSRSRRLLDYGGAFPLPDLPKEGAITRILRSLLFDREVVNR